MNKNRQKIANIKKRIVSSISKTIKKSETYSKKSIEDHYKDILKSDDVKSYSDNNKMNVSIQNDKIKYLEYGNNEKSPKPFMEFLKLGLSQFFKKTFIDNLKGEK